MKSEGSKIKEAAGTYNRRLNEFFFSYCRIVMLLRELTVLRKSCNLVIKSQQGDSVSHKRDRFVLKTSYIRIHSVLPKLRSSVNTEAKIGVFSVADQFCTFLLVLPSVGVNLSPRLSPSPESYKLKTISLWHGLRSTCSGHFIFVYLPSANMPALPLAASSNGYRANSSPSNKDDILTTHIYVVKEKEKRIHTRYLSRFYLWWFVDERGMLSRGIQCLCMCMCVCVFIPCNDRNEWNNLHNTTVDERFVVADQRTRVILKEKRGRRESLVVLVDRSFAVLFSLIPRARYYVGLAVSNRHMPRPDHDQVEQVARAQRFTREKENEKERRRREEASLNGGKDAVLRSPSYAPSWRLPPFYMNASSKDSLGKESPCLPTASALQSPGTYLLLSRSRHPIAKHMDKLVSCAAWRVAREGSGERERGEGQGQGETTRHASRMPIAEEPSFELPSSFSPSTTVDWE
ncbi:hypothetical protein V1477_008805 [Vespula maculifrons]|uniref:Uncharacterized protein n=1 Tax=Vespula maculifrons TaxID=7453 RepID=A0ABD2CE29_VESMC